MNYLFLGDYANSSYTDVEQGIAVEYDTKDIKDYTILIAAVESAGYEEWSFMLLRHKKSGKLYENHGSHCSCYGFGGQFQPEETTIKYLLTVPEIWNNKQSTQQIKEFIKTLSDYRPSIDSPKKSESDTGVMTKKAFLKLASDSITYMKQCEEINRVFKGTVLCQSKNSDIHFEDWVITLRNQSGYKFIAYVKVQVRFINGSIRVTEMPVELWQTKKEFMAFLEREVDK